MQIIMDKKEYRLYVQVSYNSDKVEEFIEMRNAFNDFLDSVDKKDLSVRMTTFKANVIDDPWKND